MGKAAPSPQQFGDFIQYPVLKILRKRGFCYKTHGNSQWAAIRLDSLAQ